MISLWVTFLSKKVPENFTEILLQNTIQGMTTLCNVTLLGNYIPSLVYKKQPKEDLFKGVRLDSFQCLNSKFCIEIKAREGLPKYKDIVTEHGHWAATEVCLYL